MDILMNFPCIFCNTRCRYSQHDDSFYCVSCNVEYWGEEDYLNRMKFRATIKDVRYELLVDINNNKTRLGYWDEYKGYSPGLEPDIFKVITEFKPVMNGVTPENVEDKIKTLLVFS